LGNDHDEQVNLKQRALTYYLDCITFTWNRGKLTNYLLYTKIIICYFFFEILLLKIFSAILSSISNYSRSRMELQLLSNSEGSCSKRRQRGLCTRNYYSVRCRPVFFRYSPLNDIRGMCKFLYYFYELNNST
jgi:hypothetical protein